MFVLLIFIEGDGVHRNRLLRLMTPAEELGQMCLAGVFHAPAGADPEELFYCSWDPTGSAIQLIEFLSISFLEGFNE